jgi:uncharacterized membrane protein
MSTKMGASNRQSNMGTAERWISLALGTEFLYRSLKKRKLSALPAAIVGTGLVYRGLMNYCAMYKALGVDRSSRLHGPDAAVTITVARPPVELYEYWRDFQNAPRYMSHVSAVRVIDATHSEWTVALPGGRSFRWTVEITADDPNSGFEWRSAPGSPISVNGNVRFKAAHGGRGTQLIASIRFSRSGGGSLLGKLAGPLAKYNARTDLARFKSLMEAGEIPTTEGQPSGRVGADQALVTSEVPA